MRTHLTIATAAAILTGTTALAGLTAEYTSLFNGQIYKFTITSESQARCPKWDPEKQENPPVQAAKALSMAKKFIATIKMKEGETWEFRDLALVDVYVWAWRARWQYLYNGAYEGPPLEMQCWILMDGTVIQPEI